MAGEWCCCYLVLNYSSAGSFSGMGIKHTLEVHLVRGSGMWGGWMEMGVRMDSIIEFGCSCKRKQREKFQSSLSV